MEIKLSMKSPYYHPEKKKKKVSELCRDKSLQSKNWRNFRRIILDNVDSEIKTKLRILEEQPLSNKMCYAIVKINDLII